MSCLLVELRCAAILPRPFTDRDVDGPWTFVHGTVRIGAMQGRAPTVAAGLLERDGEIERLEQAIAAAVEEAGSVVAVEGEAGIGKTSLLTHASRMACDGGMRTLRARGGELEREFAHGVVRQLFEGALAAAPPAERARWLAGAARLAEPVLSASAEPRGRGPEASSILHGLYWLVANLSAEQPLLICVDDAQWADDASIALLAYLARRVEDLAVLIVYASRVGEGASELLPAVAEPELVRTVLRPSPLSAAAASELVGQQLGRAGSEHFAHACHRATNGNPFLLRELLRALAADGVMPDDASAARVAQIAPKAIARATLARLRRLGAPGTQLAFAVAVLGKSADLRQAAALAELDADVATQAADALAAGSILCDGRPLEFIHPIVRTTVYDEMAPAKRATWHKRAALLLAQDGAGDVALAPHLLAAEPSGDPWVVKRLRAAAREATGRGAPDAACTYLERALAEPPDRQQRQAVVFALGSAELTVLRPTAFDRLREALDTAPDASARFSAAEELVWALVYGDRVEEGVALGTELLAAFPFEDEDARMRFEGWLAALAQFAPACARPALERLARYDGRLRGDTGAERLILAVLAFGAAHLGDSAAATAELARRAIGGGRLLHDHRVGSATFYLGVWALVYADRLDEAERWFDLVLEDGRRRGSTAAFGAGSASRCQVLVRQGRLAEAESEALGVLTTIPLHAPARGMILSCLLDTMRERSDQRVAQAFLSEHAIDGDLWQTAMAGMLLFSRGHLRLAAGDARGALSDFEQLTRRDALSGLDTPAMASRGSQALAQLALGNRDAARALSDQELGRARRWNSPSALAFALRTAGVVRGGAAGIELLRESAAAVGEAAAYERARSLAALGAALRRAAGDARGALSD
ncbi:MAG TPA: AAA family ATPase, partial [Solirubrobacteraceae bacterium]|nr:AAA family ATPase [Solirubrobacteraceae bacterium]